MGIFKKSMRVVQGYTMVHNSARAFWYMPKHGKSTKTYRNGQFFYIRRLQLERMKGIYRFSCKKNAKKLQKNTIIYIKLPRSNSHIFDYLLMQHRSPLWNKTSLPHKVYYVDTRVWYKWCLVSRGGGTMSQKIIPFLVDYIVKNGHIDPKISKTIQYSEIFLQGTNGPLSRN